MCSSDLQVADRVAVLADGKVQGVGSMSELSGMEQPAIRAFFDGARGRSAQQQNVQQAQAATPENVGRPSSKPK